MEDLRTAGANAGGKRERLETELEQVEQKISEKEAALAELLPDWEEHRMREASEKRKLDEANAKLGSLFAKQGRATKFRTRAERDNYLQHEIASMKSYQTTQSDALEAARVDLATARRSQVEVDTQIANAHSKIEDGRKKVKELGDQMVGLKDQHAELVERRKDSWREDTKLDSLVGRAADELKTAERLLGGMMDKVRPASRFVFSPQNTKTQTIRTRVQVFVPLTASRKDWV